MLEGHNTLAFLQKWVIFTVCRVALYDRASEDDFLGIYQYIMIVNERRTCATMVQQWRHDIQPNSTQHNSIMTISRTASSGARLNTFFFTKMGDSYGLQGGFI